MVAAANGDGGGLMERSIILSSRNISCLFIPNRFSLLLLFNPFMNSCDASSSLCVYLLVCSSCSSFLPKSPPVALTNQERIFIL